MLIDGKNKWIKFMKITKNEYADRVTRAYSYWLHACEAKAFRGWKSAVARGLALRKIFLFFFFPFFLL